MYGVFPEGALMFISISTLYTECYILYTSVYSVYSLYSVHSYSGLRIPEHIVCTGLELKKEETRDRSK